MKAAAGHDARRGAFGHMLRPPCAGVTEAYPPLFGQNPSKTGQGGVREGARHGGAGKGLLQKRKTRPKPFTRGQGYGYISGSAERLFDGMILISQRYVSPARAMKKNGIPHHKMSKEEINDLPLFYYSGKVSLVRSEGDLARAEGVLRNEPVLGFDTETRPSFCKGKTYSPTLVQLATAEEVFLFHLKWLPLSPALVRLFEDESIVKTGVAVHDDMRFLAKISPFTPRRVVDLGDAARRNQVENQGLRGLVACFLGLRISKSEQCSNWGNKELSARQIRYAATDAWTSRAVYLQMRELGLDL